MRTIKFRAFSKKRKEFVYLILEKDSVVCFDKNGNQDGTDLDTLDLEPWQEFTGLSDKNGKEIYEGDIIKDEEHEAPLEIQWKENEIIEGYYYRTGFDFGCYGGDCENTMVVIGNIYDKPELLK